MSVVEALAGASALFLTLFALTSADRAFARFGDFKCGNLRPSKTLQPAYKQVGKSDVCEGFYDRNISQPIAEIVSVLLEPPSKLSWPQTATVTIKTPLTPSKSKELQIQPLRISDLYRVDARFSGPLKWDSTQLHHSTKLKLADLGFLAALTDKDSADLVVAPVAISSQQVSAPVAYVTLRVSALSSAIRFRTWRFGQVAPAILEWKDAINRPKYPWTWATFSVPLEEGKSTSVDILILGETKEEISSLHLVLAGSDYG